MKISAIEPRTATAAVLAAAMTCIAPMRLAASEHVVPSAELSQRLETQAERRTADERSLQDLFASSRGALEAAGLDAEQVSEGVAALDDEDLARLAERARAFQADVAAGALTNQQITYILIALGTAVIVLLIVGAD